MHSIYTLSDIRIYGPWFRAAGWRERVNTRKEIWIRSNFVHPSSYDQMGSYVIGQVRENCPLIDQSRTKNYRDPDLSGLFNNSWQEAQLTLSVEELLFW